MLSLQYFLMAGTHWSLAKDLLVRSLAAKNAQKNDEEEVLISCGLGELQLVQTKSSGNFHF